MRAMNKIIQAVTIFLVLCFAAGLAHAQHPIDVQRLIAQGEYFKALSTYDRMPKRVATTDSVIAAGKSAWALGLNDRAIEEFDRALRSEELSREEQAQILLIRGILEFQEGNVPVAQLFAERAIQRIEGKSPIRGKAWVLWGESLFAAKAYGAAEEKYTHAIGESVPAEHAEIYFMRGRCRMRLGREAEARADFEHVPLDHERTPEAIRQLAQISLAAGQAEDAAFWLSTGRSRFPDSFLDSWVDYALFQIAAQRQDKNEMRKIREQAQKRYPPSDEWLGLLEAAAEIEERSQETMRARLKPSPSEKIERVNIGVKDVTR